MTISKFTHMKNNHYYILAGLFFTILVAACNQEKQTQQGNDKYFPAVKTIISNNCMSCHNSNGSWAGRPVKFDTDDDITSQYMAIKAAVADPVTPTNKRMPQIGTLSENDINTIVSWFNKGGKSSD